MSTREFALDLSTPLSTAAGEIDRREGVLVQLRAETADSETLTGLGEATPLPGWTESLEECRATLEEVSGAVEEGELSGVWEAADEIDAAPAARHGLALALADLTARRDGQALCDHLANRDSDAGGVDRTVRVNATIGDAHSRESVERARAAVEAGFDCLKMKVGARPVEEDVDRLAAVREVVGGSVTLRVDANAAWDRRTARRALAAVARRDIDLEYVEQPLPADDLAGHAALREREAERADGGTGIALDESLTRVDPGAVLSADAADAVVLKPMALGGPDRAVAAGRAARAAGVLPVLSTTVDAVVGRTAAAHVAAAVEAQTVEEPPSEHGSDGGTRLAPPTAHGLATAHMLASDLGPDPAPVDGGQIRLPETPGTGVDRGVFDR